MEKPIDIILLKPVEDFLDRVEQAKKWRQKI